MIFDYFNRDDIADCLTKINFNIILIFCIIFFCGIGLLYSAAGGNMTPWAIRQLVFFLIFLPIALIVAVIDTNFYFKYSWCFYLIGITLLLLVEIKGHKAMGATRWINLGIFKLQPSEIMKICLILHLAKYFHKIDLKDIRSNIKLILPFLYYFIPFVLILKQPNLGTAIILTAITFGIFFLVGVQIWKFVFVTLILMSLMPIAWNFGLKDYQKQRVMTFINPETDPLNTGYNIIQSKIAIGSGGLWGKGFIKGTQGQLEFLPEQHTDFIFTVLCEEFGFVGAVSMILLYIIFFIYIILITANCKYTFGRVICGGILINLFCHFFINIGMISGILPVVGTPLPLLSYGGSITVTTIISLGFILNIDINRYKELKTI